MPILRTDSLNAGYGRTLILENVNIYLLQLPDVSPLWGERSS